MQVLIIDDDPRLRATLAKGLEAAGHSPLAASGGEEARRLLAQGPVDLILLDVMMPDEEGWETLSRLRATGDRTPVIFVTARDAVDERVRGLELGADDYLIKPFAFDELQARIHAVARRRSEGETLEYGPLRLRPSQLTVEVDGTRIELSPREFGLLAALVRAKGRTVGRPELLREVWGIEFEPGTNTVDVHVGRLRKRLGNVGAGLVKTVVGEGYAIELPRGEA